VRECACHCAWRIFLLIIVCNFVDCYGVVGIEMGGGVVVSEVLVKSETLFIKVQCASYVGVAGREVGVREWRA
jgi:hypothetical protein